MHRVKPLKKAPPMSEQKLPNPFALFRLSSAASRTNLGAIVGLLVTPVLISVPLVFAVIFMSYSISNTPGTTASSGAIGFGGLIIGSYAFLIAMIAAVAGGLVVATLRSAKGESTTYSSSLRFALRYFWRFLGLSVLLTLMTLVGLVLLIVPGIIVLRRYFLAPYYLYDREVGIFEAMRLSAAESTKVGGVLGIVGVFVLIGVLNLVPWVGWIAAFVLNVLYACAPALRYVEIRARMAEDTTETPPARKKPAARRRTIAA